MNADMYYAQGDREIIQFLSYKLAQSCLSRISHSSLHFNASASHNNYYFFGKLQYFNVRSLSI